MRCRFESQMFLLVISVLVLVACGGSVNSSGSEVALDLTSPPATYIGAYVTVTESVSENVGTPTAAIVIATAPNDEPFDKEQPTGPAPTAPPAPTVTSDFDTDGDGFYTFEEFQQAVAALYPSYEWPDNYHVDPTTLLDSFAWSAEQGARFEVGGEYTIIGVRHECAWEIAWLDGYREGDAALMEESLAQLRTVALENPMSDSSTRDYLKEMFQRAELADPAMIQQNVDNNCSREDFISPASATPAVGS